MGYVDDHVHGVPSNQSHEETMKERLTSRKFAMLLTIFVFADILIWVGKMTSGEWLTLMSLIYGSYIIGNLYEKKSNG